MNEEILKLISKKIFKTIEADLRDRHGIRHEWDRVDEEIQQEIRDTNEAKIFKILKKVLP